MISGVVRNREALVSLDVTSAAQVARRIECVVDTGYTGYLTVPAHIVHSLQLVSAGHRRGTLADGSIVSFEMFLASVRWHDKQREVLVSQISGASLIGMSMLLGSRLIVDAEEGGRVVLEELGP